MIQLANGVEVSAGRLDVGSVSLSGGGLALADNDKVICGSGDDLQIYHDGTHSYFRVTQNNGDIYLYNNHQGIKFGAADGVRWVIDSNGHFFPDANNSYDIGTTAKRVNFEET